MEGCAANLNRALQPAFPYNMTLDQGGQQVREQGMGHRVGRALQAEGPSWVNKVPPCDVI